MYFRNQKFTIIHLFRSLPNFRQAEEIVHNTNLHPVVILRP